jgi:hypothetical protein
MIFDILAYLPVFGLALLVSRWSWLFTSFWWAIVVLWVPFLRFNARVKKMVMAGGEVKPFEAGVMIVCNVMFFGSLFFVVRNGVGLPSFGLGEDAVWIGGLLLIVTIGAVATIAPFAMQIWIASRAAQRRKFAVEAARKPVPSTEPEQMKLFGSGLIE